MAFKNRLKIEEIRTTAFGGIGAAYAAVGGAVGSPARIFILTNLTDADVYFSIDGVTNHLIVPSNSFKLIDVSANKIREDGFFVEEGTIFYAKRVAGAPSAGSIYIEVIYA